MRRTNAGIYWVRDSIPAITKMLIHEWYAADLLGAGITEEEIRDRPDAMPTIRNAKHNSRFADYVNHMVPEFRNYYRSHSDGHLNGYGRALTDRATHSIRKGEMDRFRSRPEWRPVHDMVIESISSGEPIDTAKRYAAHEQLVLIQTGDQPGVYLNLSPEGDWFYMGESISLSGRNAGHRNGNLFLRRAYITGSKSDAKNLQDSLFKLLESLNAKEKFIKQYRNSNPDPARRGAMRLESGFDIVSVLDGLVDTYYKEWCRAKAGLDGVV